MAGTMEAALFVVVESIDSKQWYTSTKQLQETLLQLLCGRAKVAARAAGRALQHLPPTADGGCWQSSPRT